MSEYQYYEFLAIDRPLTAEEISVLRALSTRAHITPVSFTNHYEWGDFKGNPDKLMELFFDAHVYVANWMTAVFKVRVPIETIPENTAKVMAAPYVLDFKATKTHWIITWSLNESENYDRFGMENGHGWMARLAPVRDEILSGDMRSLYIGWLSAVTGEMIDEDEIEPMSMEGLGRLTAAQKALAEFLEVDEDLLAGAGVGSPAPQDQEPLQEEMDAWLDGLSHDEVTALLKLLLAGKGQQAERALKNRFAAWRRGLQAAKIDVLRRTVGELRKHAAAAERIRLEQEKREQERRETKRRKEREAYLSNLSRDFPKMWKSVQQLVERGSSPAYRDACRLLVDLAEAYSVQESRGIFEQELRGFMAGHLRRKALIKRLVKAGICNEK
jgi:hypothetical protein